MGILKRPNLLFNIIASVIVVFGVAIINGCSNPSQVSHEADYIATPFDISEYPGSLGKFDYITTDSTVSDSIDSKGGSIELKLGDYSRDKLKLLIPDGALDETKLISCAIESYDTERGRYYAFNFGPDGTVFNSVAKLQLGMEIFEDYNPRDLPYLGAEMFWWNSKDSCWEWEEIDYDVGDKTVEFSISHFSRYAVGGRHSRIGNDTRLK